MISPFAQPFLMLVSPSGGVEDINYLRTKCPWVKGLFLNVRDNAPSMWDTVRQRATAANLFVGPWGRTMKAGGEFDPNMLNMLVNTADAWGAAPLIVNAESELKGSGSDLTSYIAKMVNWRQAAISMEPRPYANVQWTPVAHLPVLPQIFPSEQSVSYEPIAIRNEWWTYGVKCVYPTFGAYGGMKPSDFKLQAPYSLYPGDALMASYSLEAWAPTSQGYQGCIDATPTVPPSAPSTAETRAKIVAAAEVWEAGQPGPTPLTRITIARRIAQSGSEWTAKHTPVPGEEWTQLNQEIARLLDKAGVVA